MELLKSVLVLCLVGFHSGFGTEMRMYDTNFVSIFNRRKPRTKI